MKVIKPYTEIITMTGGMSILAHVEKCGRVCYKSEDRIKPGVSCKRLVSNVISNGHESVLEHFSITVRFVCDRGISHEIVRHRIASFSQESTRYCNYSNENFGTEITVIEPLFFMRGTKPYEIWEHSCKVAEDSYFALLNAGYTPQEARDVLPTSLKTEVMMTANLREWRHFFKLRCAADAHPQMRELTKPLLREFWDRIPVVFDDLYNQYGREV